MLSARLLFSLVLGSASPDEPRDADAIETRDTHARLQELVTQVGGPLAAAADPVAFETELSLVLADPELPQHMIDLANLAMEVELDLASVDFGALIDQYVAKFGEQQRWRVRQTLDMLLEAASRTAQRIDPTALDRSFDLRQGFERASEDDPDLMRPLLESTVCNLAAAAALERPEGPSPELSAAIMDRWYRSTHALLARIDPLQNAIDQVHQEYKDKGRLLQVQRMTYQRYTGADGELIFNVHLVVDDTMAEGDAVNLVVDSRMSWRLKDALREVEPETDFVSLKVRFASEPGPVEDIFES